MASFIKTKKKNYRQQLENYSFNCKYTHTYVAIINMLIQLVITHAKYGFTYNYFLFSNKQDHHSTRRLPCKGIINISTSFCCSSTNSILQVQNRLQIRIYGLDVWQIVNNTTVILYTFITYLT